MCHRYPTRDFDNTYRCVRAPLRLKSPFSRWKRSSLSRVDDGDAARKDGSCTTNYPTQRLILLRLSSSASARMRSRQERFYFFHLYSFSQIKKKCFERAQETRVENTYVCLQCTCKSTHMCTCLCI